MAEFEDKINSILSNPQMMQQIMSIAGSMGQQQSAPSPPPFIPPQQPQSIQQQIPFDPAALQGMLELLKSTQPDPRQQNLLNAIGAYLPADKLSRLSKAMQASRIAKYASAALNRQQSGR